MADHKMGGSPVFKNNSDAEQMLMTECPITKSPNQRNQVKRWARHMALLPCGTPAEAQNIGVSRSFTWRAGFKEHRVLVQPPPSLYLRALIPFSAVGFCGVEGAV